MATLGTLGFVSIEGLSLLDAFYLTVTTVSTVGYGDLAPTSAAGRVFAIALITGGVGTGLYFITAMAELLIEGQLRDFLGRAAMERNVEHLEGHIIVCGYGRFGRVVVDELRGASLPMVVVDVDAHREDELRRLGLPYLIADALDDPVLEHAGIARARALVITMPSDADNVFVTLSAREKNPAVQILARGETEAGLRRLELAGATRAFSAYHPGAVRMAASILHPSVVDIVDLTAAASPEDVSIEELRVAPASALAGQTVGDIERAAPRLRVIALKRDDSPVSLVPAATHTVAPEDLIVVIGNRAALDDVARRAVAAS